MARIAEYVAACVEQIERHAPRLHRTLTRQQCGTSAALVCMNQKLSVRKNGRAQAAMDGGTKLVFGRTLCSGDKHAEDQHRAEPEGSEDFEKQAAHITGAAAPLPELWPWKRTCSRCCE